MLLAALVGAASSPLGAADRPPGVSADYFAGLRAGEAQGLRAGRALQFGATLPANSRAPVRNAFDAGYVAGANDAFAGYDGGWALGTPYIVVLEKGEDGIAYRIGRRVPLMPGTAYFLCADGKGLCEAPHGR